MKFVKYFKVIDRLLNKTKNKLGFNTSAVMVCFCSIFLVTLLSVIGFCVVNAATVSIVPNKDTDKSFKKYGIKLAGTQTDYARVIKIVNDKDGIVNFCYSVEECDDTFVKFAVYRDAECTIKVSPKFSYAEEISQGILSEYLSGGTYYLRVETSPNFNKSIYTLLAVVRTDLKTEMDLNATSKYTNKGSLQYYKFTLAKDSLLNVKLVDYDNDSGYYFTICDSDKNSISSQIYLNVSSLNTALSCALRKGTYYLRMNPKNTSSESTYYLKTSTTSIESKNNTTEETALNFNTDKQYSDVLFNKDPISNKSVYKITLNHRISAKVLTSADFNGKVYAKFTGGNVTQNVFKKYVLLEKGTYYLSFYKRSASDGGIFKFMVLTR